MERYYFSLFNDEGFDTGHFFLGNSKKAAVKHSREIMEKHGMRIAKLEVSGVQSRRVLDFITIEL